MPENIGISGAVVEIITVRGSTALTAKCRTRA
jgi:hypothetical protein